MSKNCGDDFFWSPVQVGDKFYVVMDYYLINGVKVELGQEYETVWDALTEANLRNAREVSIGRRVQ